MALGSRAIAAIGAAAIAASVLIACLLLGGEAGGGGAAGPAGARARPAPDAPETPAPLTRGQAAAPGGHDPPPPDPPPVAEGPSVEVRVLLDGIQPVPGCPVMGAERDSDGELLACFGDGGPVSGETDGEGRFVLRWPAEPRERLVAVFLDRSAKVASVDGAAEAGRLSGGQAVLLAGAAPVTVHLADDGGRPRLRILDDATGAPLVRGVDPIIEWEWRNDDPSDGGRVPLRHEAAGWWDIGPVPAEAIRPRVRAAGYRDHPLEEWDRTGRHTIRIGASGTGVTGVLAIPRDLATGPVRVEARLVRVDGGDRGPRSPLGRVGPGAFLLDGLDPGEWRLEVRWRPSSSGQVASWTVKRFAYDGKRLDLGTLEAEPGATVRVRWAFAGTLPEGATIVMRDRRHDVSTGIVDRGWLVSDGPISPYPEARRPAPPAEAEFVFDGLLPGSEYEITCPRIPGWKEAVRAPEEPGGERTHGAGLDLRLVRCRISFTVDGAKPARPLMIRGPGVSKILTGSEDVVECTLPSGRHSFVCQIVDVEQTGDSGVVRLSSRGTSLRTAEVEVPSDAEYETTVDLKSR